MTGPIFGTSSGSGSSNGNRHLVEFRAGRMNMVGKMVHPDKRKGLLYVYQADADSLIHFCWKDITTGVVEDDLIIFPDDCEFKRVDQCKTGRVYLLKFKASNRRLFFWMQESKTDKDDDLCRRVNDSINNPPPQNMGGGGGRGGGADSNDLQYMINNMSPAQLVQLFNGVNQMGGLNSIFGANRTSDAPNSRSSPTPTSTAAAATPTTAPQSTATPQAPRKVTTRRSGVSQDGTPASSTAAASTTTAARTSPPTETATTGTAGSSDSNSVLLSELRNFLSGLSPGAEGAGRTAGGSQNVDFSTAITSEALNPILNDNPDWVAQLEEHLPDVGTDDTKKQQLRDTISSPQFQQALSMFSNALQSGQLGPVVSQFKLSTAAVEAANQGDLEKFVRALETSAKEVSKAAAAAGESQTTEVKGDGAAAAADTTKDEDEEMKG